MDPFGVRIMDLAEAKLGWLGRRQQVLAENVANADTPDYRPRDLGTFGSLLRGKLALAPARTAEGHLAGKDAAASGGMRARPDRSVREVSPNGNAVALDEQLMKLADTELQHGLALSLYHKTVSLFRVALGRAA